MQPCILQSEAARLQISFQILQPRQDKTLHGRYEAICNIAVAFDLFEEVVSNSLDIVKSSASFDESCNFCSREFD